MKLSERATFAIMFWGYCATCVAAVLLFSWWMQR